MVLVKTIRGIKMGCWLCNYFYTAKEEEPCKGCNNKDKFVLWESKKGQ